MALTYSDLETENKLSVIVAQQAAILAELRKVTAKVEAFEAAIEKLKTQGGMLGRLLGG